MDFFANELDSLKYLVAGSLIAEDGFLHMRRVLDCHVLILVLEGTLFITQDDREFAVGAGETILLARGLEHFGTRRSEGRLSYLWAHFCTESQWQTTPPENYACHLPESFTVANTGRLRRLFDIMLDCSRREDTTAPEMTLCALKMLLLECSYQAGIEEQGISPLVREIVMWVRRNCHRRLTVADIAERFHYSPDYISALFRREMGDSLSAFLNNCRMELAKDLLSEGTVSIKEVAYSCGFSDEKYFTRVFRKTMGMTPTEYRSKGGGE
ncbi:helix-turn-helix transcriptional regulator [Ruminococcus albus]|uniref:AraC-like ligand binding domain-containing protein n=1 Tax=Ruminococcus albus TaxID=1264 RepID=A0A1I1EYD7_RUMAL|nr:AraC family transcriptional regulator [Ruminococcus albus]SFB89923.1 AraC-like ligand binding domain-containing protein [Ruminococcus albus]